MAIFKPKLLWTDKFCDFLIEMQLCSTKSINDRISLVNQLVFKIYFLAIEVTKVATKTSKYERNCELFI